MPTVQLGEVPQALLGGLKARFSDQLCTVWVVREPYASRMAQVLVSFSITRLILL
jgi:hypothetical protein